VLGVWLIGEVLASVTPDTLVRSKIARAKILTK
jgi:hypothetical protein